MNIEDPNAIQLYSAATPNGLLHSIYILSQCLDTVFIHLLFTYYT